MKDCIYGIMVGTAAVVLIALLAGQHKRKANPIEAPTTRKAVVWMTPDRVSVIWIQANNWTNGESTFYIPPWIDKTNLAKAVWRWAQSEEMSRITNGYVPRENGFKVTVHQTYGTYVDSSNYERVMFENLSDKFEFVFRIKMESAGVGFPKPIYLYTDKSLIVVNTNGVAQIAIESHVPGLTKPRP